MIQTTPQASALTAALYRDCEAETPTMRSKAYNRDTTTRSARTNNEGRPKTKLSHTGDNVDATLREAQVVLERVGEEAKGVTGQHTT